MGRARLIEAVIRRDSGAPASDPREEVRGISARAERGSQGDDARDAAETGRYGSVGDQCRSRDREERLWWSWETRINSPGPPSSLEDWSRSVLRLISSVHDSTCCLHCMSGSSSSRQNLHFLRVFSPRGGVRRRRESSAGRSSPPRMSGPAAPENWVVASPWSSSSPSAGLCSRSRRMFSV